jgi:hypothetical protein
MVAQLNLSDAVYEFVADVAQLPQAAYARLHPDDLWFDLWTDKNAYDRAYKEANAGWSIDGILSLGDLLEQPVLPERLVLFGWFDLLEQTDLPTNSVHWPIVSSRVLSALQTLQVEPKLHRVRVLDRTPFSNVYGEDVRRYETDAAVAEVQFRDDWFYGIQLQAVNILSDDSDLNAFPPKIVWRRDVDGVPPCFVDPKSPGRLLVTREARDALETAGVRGVRYTAPFQ